MAAASIDKMTAAQVSATFNHNYRKSSTHTNGDIQPELADENVILDDRTPQQLAYAFKADISATDAFEPPKNVRKDRIVGLGVIVNYPRDLTEDDIIRKKVLDKDGKEKELIYVKPEVKADFIDLCKKSIPEIEKQLNGKAYGATVHFDEVHEYLDPETKKMTISRPHMHLIVPARAEILEKTGEKDKKGKDIYKHTGRYRINGRDALQRTTYNKVNARLDDICLDTFGYAYRDGSKKHAPRKTIDELKRASSDALQKEIDKNNIKLQTLRNDLKNIENEYNLKQSALDNLQTEFDEKTQLIQDKRNELTDLQSSIDTINQKIQRIERRLTDLQADVDTKQNEIDTKTEELTDLQSEVNKAQEEVNALQADKTSIQNEISDLEDKLIDKNKELYLKDKPKFLGNDKVKVDKQAYKAYQDFYNNGTEKKVKNREKALDEREKQLNTKELNLNQRERQQKWQSDGQYKEDAQKYKNILKDVKSKDEIKKMIDDKTCSLSDISREIRLYALTRPDKEKENLLKGLKAVDTLDTYIYVSYKKRPVMDIQERAESLWDYQDKIIDMYKDILDYKGRNNLYKKIPKVWKEIKADNSRYWEKYKTAYPEGYIDFSSMSKNLGGSVVQAFNTYKDMQEQAQQQYESER